MQLILYFGYLKLKYHFSYSIMSFCLWPHGLQHTRLPCPSPTSELTKAHVHWDGDATQPSHPLLPSSPFAFIFPGIFSNELAICFSWPKYWSFSFSISPSNEHPELNSFRIDWLDLIAIQWTLNSLFQHHSSKASILLHSAFFIAQLSLPHMTTGKTIALTRWTFIDKVICLCFLICCLNCP